MSYRIELADVSVHAEAARELAEENWAETGFDFDLALDVPRLAAAQEAGVWFALAAWDGQRMVGYSSACVTTMTFNPAIVACLSDALFVDRQHRTGTLPGRLIRATEGEAKRRGAMRMMWHCRGGTALADTFMRRGYSDVQHTVMRRL